MREHQRPIPPLRPDDDGLRTMYAAAIRLNHEGKTISPFVCSVFSVASFSQMHKIRNIRRHPDAVKTKLPVTAVVNNVAKYRKEGTTPNV